MGPVIIIHCIPPTPIPEPLTRTLDNRGADSHLPDYRFEISSIEPPKYRLNQRSDWRGWSLLWWFSLPVVSEPGGLGELPRSSTGSIYCRFPSTFCPGIKSSFGYAILEINGPPHPTENNLPCMGCIGACGREGHPAKRGPFLSRTATDAPSPLLQV